MKLKVTLFAATLALGVWSMARAEDAKPAEKYPLDTCVVSGEKLDEMGKPVELEYEGQKVLFCCKSCVKKFKAEPAKYMAKIAAARDAAAKQGQDGQQAPASEPKTAPEAK
jgi:YHS domain-containing protein